MGGAPSGTQLALLVLSLTAGDDDPDLPLTYGEALGALIDPDVRTATVRGWDAARAAAAESICLLRGLGPE